MICPECKSEYNPGITVCADCGIPLVAGLPETEKEKDDDNHPTGFAYEDLVTVLQTGDQGLFLMAESLLEEAGIHYCVSGEITRHYMGFNPGAPPCLKVRESDAERAKELLTDFLQAVETGGDGELSAEADRLYSSDD